jgi:hypothetical protein
MALRDLDALASFAELEILDLSLVPVSDIGFLKDSKKLRELDLRGTQVTDISALAGVTSLERLNLSQTQVTDLSPLLPLLRAGGLPLIELPDDLIDEQLKALTEASTLPPEEIESLAPTGLTLVVCDANNELLDTLVVKPDVKDAEFELRIPEAVGEIRVFGLGSRMRKNPNQWEYVHDTFTQFYTVARANDKVTQEVTAYLKNGVFSYFGTSLATADESRPIRLTETLRNRIKADIAADQRSIPIFLVEESKNTSGGFGDVLITRKPVE